MSHPSEALHSVAKPVTKDDKCPEYWMMRDRKHIEDVLVNGAELQECLRKKKAQKNG
jgi:predicted RNase H-like nuclease (RuvC/YqgF family)